MDADRLPTKVMHCNIEGKTNRGRQPKTWMNSIKGDLKARNIAIRAAVGVTGDFEKWRRSYNLIELS